MSLPAAILRRACAFLREVAEKPVPPANEVELRAVTAAELAEKFAPRPRRKELKHQEPVLPAPEKMTTSEIRAACVARAQGICECGCGSRLDLRGETMDHWLNGSGNRKKFESVETCWMLTLKCHRDRQEYRIPAWAEVIAERAGITSGVEFWNWRFRLHCERWRYPFVPHIVHQQLQRRLR